jgi:UBX domain-containing protein 1
VSCAIQGCAGIACSSQLAAADSAIAHAHTRTLGCGCRYTAFAGEGRTLGGGASSSSGGAGSSAAAAAAAAANADAGEWAGVDESQPTTSIQLRLHDGSRMVARLNAAHSVADIRRFIRAARPDLAGASYALLTGFPPAPITDEGQSLEAAGLLNAVINTRPC